MTNKPLPLLEIGVYASIYHADNERAVEILRGMDTLRLHEVHRVADLLAKFAEGELNLRRGIEPAQ